ncbi:hypothetical protein [Salinisphaera sp. T31B1]|uniref:hypothetical protein n=1 Tax=Salinisphaera sp. T31B1 TaxID=727963 RepID=UPI0033401F6E
MKTKTPQPRAREYEILVLLEQNSSVLSTLVQKVSFTRHESRVHALLSCLAVKGEAIWSADGQWRITPRGMDAVRLAAAP